MKKLEVSKIFKSVKTGDIKISPYLSGTLYQQCSLFKDVPCQQNFNAAQADLISIVQLKQFANTRKAWFVTIHFCY